jgi:hypothetical protein
MEEVYLGDGLYVSVEGGMFKLRAPRGPGDHVVYLDIDLVTEFFRYVRKIAPNIDLND